MAPTPSLVCVVDDDESVRESLSQLLQVLGFEARAFASAEAFLGSDCVGAVNCLLLDVVMPGMSGPDLQRELSRRGLDTSIIFITGQNRGNLRERLLESGAVACLFKPFGNTELLDAIETALRAT
jgi:FixJ family two-component response regulator